MPKTIHTSLTRREREILDILYRLGRAGVSEVLAELSGSPAYSTVRAQLRVLEEKGHVRHQEQELVTETIRLMSVPPRPATNPSAPVSSPQSNAPPGFSKLGPA